MNNINQPTSPAPVHRLVGRSHRKSKAEKEIRAYIEIIKYLLKKVSYAPISSHRDFDDEHMMGRIKELVENDEAELNPPNTSQSQASGPLAGKYVCHCCPDPKG